ncbi:MAG: PAS domain S-box protein [Bacteroidetes bacterium]|nr:PAS domain S-box protein [Bacteroidota bacterium]MBU2585190.1 PAS domain S-box protein [Bacteroidota bacterium]
MNDQSKTKNETAELRDELTKTKNFVDCLLNGANVIIVGLDVQGNIKLFNEAAEHITGYESSDVAGKNWFEVLVPEKKYPQVTELFEKFQNNQGLTKYYENPVLTKNGEERIISWQNTEWTEDGQIIGTISFGIDITDRIVIENDLREQKRVFTTLVENLPGIIYRCSNDENWTMEYISSACEKLTGYKPDEIIGNRKVSFSDLIHPEDREKVWNDVQEALSKKIPFQLNYRIVDREGNVKWVSEQGKGVFDEDGNLTALEGFINDETEKRKAEADLFIQREYFKQLFENSPLAIAMLNSEDIVINVNKAFEELFHYKRAEVIGKFLNPFIAPEGLEEEATHLSNKVLDNEIVIAESKRKRKDGTLVDVLILGYSVLYEGERIGIYGVYRDISEQKKMIELLRNEKERAEEMVRLKSNFLLNMSHEIRTPMNSIMGFSDILHTELRELDNESLIDFAISIKDSAERLMNLINNILEISQIEASKKIMEILPYTLLSLVEPTVNNFLRFADQKGLTLEIECINDKMVLVDPIRFEQPLRNVIDNAVKFTKRGSVRIVLDAAVDSKNEPCGEIKVIDTGIGISKEFLPKIFNDFEQESSGLDRRFEGAGLGLTLTKKLIELMNGEIQVESELGKGTTVKIHLPLA